MLRYFIIFLVIFCNPFYSYNQNVIHFYDSTGYDSSGKEQGYWKLPSGFNIVINEKHMKGLEVYEYGYFVNGNRIGIWNIKDKNGKLVGHRWYNNDTIVSEISYYKGKITSISRMTYKPSPPNNKGITIIGTIIDIIFFDKKGKPKSRIYKSPNGEEIIEKY